MQGIRFWMRARFHAAAGAAAIGLSFIATQPALSSPLELAYTAVADPSQPTTYDYTFVLALTNADGTWVSEERFNNVVFGENTIGNSNYGAFGSFSFASMPAGLFSTVSFGSIYGPTLSGTGTPIDQVGSNLGWNPASFGSTLTWSGTSPTLLGQGQLYFSTLSNAINGLQLNNGASAQLAAMQAVPEPGTFALMSIGILGAAFIFAARGINLNADNGGVGRQHFEPWLSETACSATKC